MKYATAIGHLRKLADALTELHQGSSPGVHIVTAWVYGRVLDGTDSMDWAEIALQVDLRPEEVTWLTRPVAAEGIAHLLRLPKLPLAYAWRPAGWPVWNHGITRAARFWSMQHGPDDTNLGLLGERRNNDVAVAQPSDDGDRLAQLRVELAASRAHLATVLDGYYDREWREAHHTPDLRPEDHLWFAAAAVRELHEAVAELDG